MALLKFACLVTGVALLIGSARTIYAGAEVLYEDNFERLDPGWGDPSDLVSAKEGKLILRPKAGTSQSVQHQGIIVEDGNISATIKLVKDDGKVQATGVIFWGTDYQSYYVVDITPDGRYAVTRWTKGRWLYPVSYRKCESVKKDYGQENTIRVMTKGNMATVYVNEVEVVSIKGQPPKGGGMVGLYAESGTGEQTIAEFTKFRVTSLP